MSGLASPVVRKRPRDRHSKVPGETTPADGPGSSLFPTCIGVAASCSKMRLIPGFSAADQG
ncbi:hypothetical protein IF2G_02470 [Cordyceps javanica]|nr:hypothetical protein IF2G_02470 [Cordyceps javanica]